MMNRHHLESDQANNTPSSSAGDVLAQNSRSAPVRMLLVGDVMTGRGIDQILPHPSRPEIHEPYINSALEYVRLAEWAYGNIPRPIDERYIWGDALQEIAQRDPEVLISNLETAITTTEQYEKKGINYRMSPDNLAALKSAGFDCCVLANNHTLDWCVQGLRETLNSLQGAGLHTAGAGKTIFEATAPAIVPLENGRALIFAVGHTDSGIPDAWAATEDRPGISVLSDYTEASVQRIAARVAAAKRKGDIAVLSIHWGSNWGYDIDFRQVWFARRLIDTGGIDIVHGHSSHHPKKCEIYKGHLIIYGCGDLINDYEGIGGHEAYRPDLALLYFPTIDPATGFVTTLDLVPMQIRHYRLRYAQYNDAVWLKKKIKPQYPDFAPRLEIKGAHTLSMEFNQQI